MKNIRSVLTASDIERMKKQGKDVSDKPDDLLTQVGKSVPAEVLAFYLPAIGALSLAGEGDPIEIGAWLIFGLGFIFTIGYAIVKFRKEGAVGIALKTAVSTVAFVLWSFNLGGYTNYLDWFNQLYATIFLGAFSLATPLIFKIYDIVTKPS